MDDKIILKMCQEMGIDLFDCTIDELDNILLAMHDKNFMDSIGISQNELFLHGQNVCDKIVEIIDNKNEKEGLWEYTPKGSSPKDLTWDGVIYYDANDDEQYKSYIEIKKEKGDK